VPEQVPNDTQWRHWIAIAQPSMSSEVARIDFTQAATASSKHPTSEGLPSVKSMCAAVTTQLVAIRVSALISSDRCSSPKRS